MKKQVEFSFGDDSIAKAYDTVLVPSLFEPWASQLVIDNKPWNSCNVLDLACGTGVVTKELAKSVGSNGKVIALDINSQMLNQAKIKCNEWANNIEFIEGSAESLDISDNSMDKVVCQQGFQFFPNKKTAANEIYRVLKPRGKAIISTWCPVSECEIFGIICDTLESMNLNEISQMMRVPFDFLTQEELLQSFSDIGFSDIQFSKQEQILFIEGGMNGAITFVYATPIGPKLTALRSEEQENFKKLFTQVS
jgi:ubiquinone/menaquinone biosynthesis C-methylase UbiE